MEEADLLDFGLMEDLGLQAHAYKFDWEEGDWLNESFWLAEITEICALSESEYPITCSAGGQIQCLIPGGGQLGVPNCLFCSGSDRVDEV